jgi:3-hydroxybutyryl-CoA dehydrogenase
VSKAKIGVIGAGLMGHGIAYRFAAAGHEVGVFEPSAELRATLPKRLSAIADLLGDDPACLTGISVHDQLALAVKETSLVVEAAPEKLALKQQLFADIEANVAADTILASNSSAIPSTEIGRHLTHRERVVGMHFWNPPHLVPLVEVIQTEKTSEPVIARTMALLASVGLKPVHVRKDIPGFIGNRLQHALKREAIALVADGVCDAETIDDVVKNGFGARMSVLGPMEQSDLVGLDLTFAIHETLIQHLDRTTGPHPFLRSKIAQGKLGMKTGEGFRRWTPQQADEVRQRLSRFLADQAKARRQTCKPS